MNREPFARCASLGGLSALVTLLPALLLAASPLPADPGELAGQPAVADAITLLDLWIDEQVAYHNLPGLSIGIVYDQELIWAHGYGFSDPETRDPGFRIRSPLPDAPPITVRHLLTHTSGLPREGAFPYWTTHQFPALTRLVPVAADAFRLPDGELVVFELDEDGNVERIRRRYDYLYPVSAVAGQKPSPESAR